MNGYPNRSWPILSVRVSPDDKALIERAAVKDRYAIRGAVSAWARQTLLEAAAHQLAPAPPATSPAAAKARRRKRGSPAGSHPARSRRVTPATRRRRGRGHTRRHK